MALIACPECKGRVSMAAFTCPHCGFPLDSRDLAHEQVNPGDEGGTETATQEEVSPQSVLSSKVAALGGILMNQELILTDLPLSNLRPLVSLCSGLVTKLEVVGEGWRDRHVDQVLSQLPRLRELSLSLCERLTDESLLYISKVTSLNRLSLKGCNSSHFTLSGMKLLAQLPQLELLCIPDGWRLHQDATRKDVTELAAHLKRALPQAVIQGA